MVKVRKYRKTEMYEVDIRFKWPDGTSYRERVRSPVSSKTGAERWGQAREVALLSRGKPPPAPAQPKEVPTLQEFEARYLDNYARANRQKASSIDAKVSIFKHHLVPKLGTKRLDAITDEDVQALKTSLAGHKRKTANNVLSLLGNLLRVAVRWRVIPAMPCVVELYKVSNVVPEFYEFADYARLTEAAEKIDTGTSVAILLGGDAGLRRGEICGLRRCDVDLKRRQLRVEQSEWKGVVDTPKGGRGRIVPMTDALFAALQKHRHLRGERVLTLEDGSPVAGHVLRDWIERAQRRAGLPPTGNAHILRHTFCSHLAMRGAPAKAIQELAGHASLSTTLRYMHLSPAARTSAIALLNGRGEGVEKSASEGTI
ncbi:MAG: site-specific integrase [Myxococcales bacterium]|nr:site-specific integrase [Myxococcales bacterium]